MIAWLKSLFDFGSIVGESLNKAIDMWQSERDKAAGHNEANLEARVKQDESKKRADAIYDRPVDNRIKRMRNKDIPPTD